MIENFMISCWVIPVIYIFYASFPNAPTPTITIHIICLRFCSYSCYFAMIMSIIFGVVYLRLLRRN